MSKGHQAHRRRTYGRRQHELHERRMRHETWHGLDITVADIDDAARLDAFDLLRPSGPRAFDVLGSRSRWVAEAG